MSSIIRVDTLQKPDGSTPTAADLGIDVAGSVVQVVSSDMTNAMATSVLGWVDSGLTATITPKSSTSKILVSGKLSGSGSGTHIQYKLVRDTTDIAIGDASGSRTRATGWVRYGQNGDDIHEGPFTHLDSPATTSAVTYKVMIRNNNNANIIYVNHSVSDADSAAYARTMSNITLQEIAQ